MATIEGTAFDNFLVEQAVAVGCVGSGVAAHGRRCIGHRSERHEDQ